MPQALSIPGAVEDLFVKADRSGARIMVLDAEDRVVLANQASCELYPFVDFAANPRYEEIFWGCINHRYFVDDHYYYSDPAYWIEHGKKSRHAAVFSQFVRKYTNGRVFAVYHEKIGGFGSYLARIDVTDQFTRERAGSLIGPSLWAPLFRPEDPWSTSGVLEGIRLAACVVDAQGVMLDANRRMLAALQAADGLRLAQGRLVAASRAETAVLYGLVRRCADLRNVSFTARVTRPGSQHPCAVLVSSEIPAEWWRGRRKTPAALVTAVAPETAPRVSGQELERLYGLTPSEARVASTLAAGLSPQEIADQTGTAVGTVRNQLKAVYAKLGVSRQSDVVVVVGNIARLLGK